MPLHHATVKHKKQIFANRNLYNRRNRPANYLSMFGYGSVFRKVADSIFLVLMGNAAINHPAKTYRVSREECAGFASEDRYGDIKGELLITEARIICTEKWGAPELRRIFGLDGESVTGAPRVTPTHHN
ncbi:hypothetical protein Zmor_019326 [Zophobas morio]|uniref:Uncharacterized protein n=1 Tax=Zophobas morio TaxID=2755281 RepID=A0AA38I1H1_9CUCU|nr:hypothetical protein Zmor_019326 [Zophobas morio]